MIQHFRACSTLKAKVDHNFLVTELIEVLVMCVCDVVLECKPLTCHRANGVNIAPGLVLRFV